MSNASITSIDPSGQYYEEADSKLLSEIIRKTKGPSSTKW